jgi:hypothetical protein
VRSLQRRLQLGLAISILLFTLLFLLLGGYTIRQLGESYVLARSEHDAEALLATIGFNRRGELVHRPNRIAAVYHQPHSGHYYMFAVGDAPPVSSRSMWDFRFDLQRVAPGEARVRRIAGPAQQQLLLLTRGYRKQGQELTIAVAEDISAMEVDIRRYQLGSGVALLAL